MNLVRRFQGELRAVLGTKDRPCQSGWRDNAERLAGAIEGGTNQLEAVHVLQERGPSSLLADRVAELLSKTARSHDAAVDVMSRRGRLVGRRTLRGAFSEAERVTGIALTVSRAESPQG